MSFPPCRITPRPLAILQELKRPTRNMILHLRYHRPVNHGTPTSLSPRDDGLVFVSPLALMEGEERYSPPVSPSARKLSHTPSFPPSYLG